MTHYINCFPIFRSEVTISRCLRANAFAAPAVGGEDEAEEDGAAATATVSAAAAAATTASTEGAGGRPHHPLASRQRCHDDASGWERRPYQSPRR